MKQGDDLHSHAQFFEAYSSKLNVSVVAIRGTDVGRISDLIEDIKVGLDGCCEHDTQRVSVGLQCRLGIHTRRVLFGRAGGRICLVCLFGGEV